MEREFIREQIVPTGKRILSEGGDHDNGIKVHNQQGRPANWITARCRLMCIASSAKPDRILAYSVSTTSLRLSLLLLNPCTRIYTCTYIYMCTYAFSPSVHTKPRYRCLRSTQPLAPYSPCTGDLGTWYGIPTWHRNWFATTLLAASALSYPVPSPAVSSPGPTDCQAGCPSSRCLQLPASQQPRSP